MKRIMLDIDGVLADFVLAYTREAVKLGFLENPISTIDQPTWSFDGIGLTEAQGKEVWQYIDSQRFWWLEKLPSLMTAQQTDRIRALKYANELYFCTKRRAPETASISIQYQTQAWLENTIGAGGMCVIPSMHKGEVAKALRITHAIDDRPENVVEIAKTVSETYMFTRRYNELVYYPKRVADLDAFLRLLESQ